MLLDCMVFGIYCTLLFISGIYQARAVDELQAGAARCFCGNSFLWSSLWIAGSSMGTEGREVRNSLGPGTALFRPWLFEELPAEWQVTALHPHTRYVAVELPDTAWGTAYHDWFVFGGPHVIDYESLPGVMVVNMRDYNGGRDQHRQSGLVLQALLQSGRPPPNFIRVLHECAAAEAEGCLTADGGESSR